MASPSELLEWLATHDLLTPEQVTQVHPLLITFVDCRMLAKELLRLDWITPYQANQILQDKGESLVVGTYRLRERLGEGAMGQVFKAYSLRLRRDVALKTIRKDLVTSAKTLERFRREIQAASQLDHPNIVLCRDTDEIDGRLILVMDYVQGLTLSHMVKTRGALPYRVAVDYVRQAARGLQHAFERGIVHRDVKPSNLILDLECEGGPRIKILDFGLARFESEPEHANRLTQVNNLLGTVDYMPPEQATDPRNADVRADIYSLGCTLFYLIRGGPAFLGSTFEEKMLPRMTGDPPDLRKFKPEVPEGLSAALQKMMARRPEDRFAQPTEVDAALQPFSAGATGTPAVVQAVPLNLPVPAGASIPLALPLGPPASPSSPPASDPLPWMAESAPSPDAQADQGEEGVLPTGDLPLASTRPPARRRRAARGLWVWGVVAGVSALLLGGGFVLLKNFPTSTAKRDAAADVKITKAMLSIGNEPLRPGDRKLVLVWIDRKGFKGTVRLSLKKTPDGVVGGEKELAGNQEKGDLSITVSHGTNPSVHQIAVVAEAGSTRAEFPLSIVIGNKR